MARMPFFEEPEPPEPVVRPERQYHAIGIDSEFGNDQDSIRRSGHLHDPRQPSGQGILRGLERNGFSYRIDAWLRPGTEPWIVPYGLGPDDPYGLGLDDPSGRDVSRPRTGWLLDGVTKIGASPSDGLEIGEDPFAAGDPRHPRLVGGGSFGGIRIEASGWVYPLPHGTTLELVVAWPHRGIPESYTPVDLGEIRAAAARSEILWKLPPPPTGNGEYGWFGYAPHYG